MTAENIAAAAVVALTIELNPQYIQLSERRSNVTPGLALG